MDVSITPLYAVILTILFLVLSVRVIAARRSGKIAYGSGGDTDTEARIRAQANWAEYVPIALLLMLLAEVQGAQAFSLHVCGIILVIGRGLHGFTMGFNRTFFFGRVGGTAATLSAIILLLLVNILNLV